MEATLALCSANCKAALTTRPQLLCIRCDVEPAARASFHPMVVASIDPKRVVSILSSFVHAASVVTRCKARALFSLQPSLLPSIESNQKKCYRHGSCEQHVLFRTSGELSS